jgi:hypothetical protein
MNNWALRFDQAQRRLVPMQPTEGRIIRFFSFAASRMAMRRWRLFLNNNGFLNFKRFYLGVVNGIR